MADKEKIVEKVVAEVDWYIIGKIREFRKTKFSQAALSREIGFSEGFIGRIENPSQSAVYSPRHINLIARALKVNVADIMPKQPLQHDLIRIVIRIKRPTKIKKGEVNYEIIKKIPLTPEEIKEYNNGILNRPTKSGESPKFRKRKSVKSSGNSSET